MRKQVLIIVSVLAFTLVKAQPLSQQVAATVMYTWKDSFSLEQKPVKWSYDLGVILKGFEGIWNNTGDVRYFQYIQKQIDFYVDSTGSIKAYKPDEYNIDYINNGKLLLTLYRVTLKEKYLKAAKKLREQLKTHPRTNEGGFWHKKIYPNQMWLDGLYMGTPFYAEYAMLSKDEAAFDDIANQFIWMESHARDAKTGLLYHAWDESKTQQWANKETGRSPLVWARAMGWYGSALVDVLDYFPETHPKRKSLIDILNRYVDAVAQFQNAQSGLWYDVLNYDGPDKEKNYEEASASCQFVYTIAKAVRKGYVPAQKMTVAKKGYDGIVKKFIRKDGAMAHLQGTVKVSGLGGSPYRDGSFTYYMSEPVIEDDPKGLGAFLLASSEMELWPSAGFAKGKRVVMDNYFNRETKKDAFGNTIVFHYKWGERDNGGFSMFGHIFEKYGAVTSFMNEAPTDANLKGVGVYVLVDPDWPKENKTPNYIETVHADALERYVRNGGTLLMMANDSNNVEFKNFNGLAERFGIHWNEDMRHDVINNQFEQGEFSVPAGHPIFKTAKTLFIKQVCTQSLKSPAFSVFTDNGDVVMSVAYVGKGAVFAVSDPWFYNEYVDGRKLPVKYENYKAAEDLAQWLLKPLKIKATK
ncbi:MAG: glycoside hydrolase family 88 protein [Chitinophagaceae bacterium]